MINAELALLFNETCKNENIPPRYTEIYIYIYKCFVSRRFEFIVTIKLNCKQNQITFSLSGKKYPLIFVNDFGN